MAEPDLLQRERKMLREFRQSNLSRPKTEADAEALRKSDVNKIEASVKQTGQTADDLFSRAKKSLEIGREVLATGKLEYLLEQTRPTQSMGEIDAEPSKELEDRATAAEAASNNAQINVIMLLTLRENLAKRHRLLIRASAIVVVILAIAGFFAYGAWQRSLASERIYGPAIVAFEAGQWEAAQAGFEQLNSEDKNYKDAQKFLRESYYRGGVAALENGQWQNSRSQFQRLVQIEGNYRDTQMLLRESFYRPALLYLNSKEWDQAKEQLNDLINLDANYRDAQTLLKESYYRAGVDYLSSGDQDKAQSELMSLARKFGEYRDMFALMRTKLKQQRLRIEKVNASGWHHSDPLENTIDGNINTAVALSWDAPAWLEITWSEPVLVTELLIYTVRDTPNNWAEIKTAKVTSSDGHQQTVHLDNIDGWQRIPLNPALVHALRIEVNDVYGRGEWWIMVSDLAVEGYK